MDLTNAQKWMLVYSMAASKAWDEPEFKEKLKQDPAKTLLDTYDYKIPEPIEIKFVEMAEADFDDFKADFESFNEPSLITTPLTYPLSSPPEPFENGYERYKSLAIPGSAKCCCACF